MKNAAYLELMRNELFVLEKTNHPHIVSVYELLEDNNKFYVVMEFISDGDLLHYIKNKTPSEESTLEIIY